ncbi:MAG: gliding motility lipoprotein GldD [Bacteroidota bacterium]|nr:gliding motility lipoprotein GldD [Bacteroidota bacterium]
MKKFFSILLIFALSCNSDYTPKPKGYFKLDLPKKTYIEYKSDCPFSFSYPTYSIVEELESCMLNINFLSFNAKLHITYLPLSNNLYSHIEQSRNLAYKHNIKANMISEEVFVHNDKNVFGMLYDYDGLTATAAQFYLTDSIHHFFRGALYFNTEVNDSILPINNFLKQDIRIFIESFDWKDK